MVVIGGDGGFNIVSREQLRRHPRILGQQLIGCAQRVERAQGNVAKIAYWRGNHVKAGRERDIRNAIRSVCVLRVGGRAYRGCRDNRTFGRFRPEQYSGRDC